MKMTYAWWIAASVVPIIDGFMMSSSLCTSCCSNVQRVISATSSRTRWYMSKRVTSSCSSSSLSCWGSSTLRTRHYNNKQQWRGFIASASKRKMTPLLDSGNGPACSREAFNERQKGAFSGEVDVRRFDKIPEDVVPKLAAIARATNLPADGVVVDVGTGTGCLVPHFMKERGISASQVVGIDLSADMIKVFQENNPEATAVVSDFLDWTSEEPVDCVVYNACFGNLYSQSAHLAHAAELLKVGGTIVISHPLGAKFVTRLKTADEDVVPLDLPKEAQLKRMIKYLPLEVKEVTDSNDFYLAVLERIGQRFMEKCIYLKGEVATGYGRGSKNIGVPTANLPESLFADSLKDMQTGVYIGWGLVEETREGGGGSSTTSTTTPALTTTTPVKSAPYKMIVNIGYSPTFVGQENREKIAEAHLIDYEGGDFYGKQLRLLILGFKRKERKFNSFPELVSTITQDVADAREALSQPPFQHFRHDAFFDLEDTAPSGGGGVPSSIWKEVAVEEAEANIRE